MKRLSKYIFDHFDGDLSFSHIVVSNKPGIQPQSNENFQCSNLDLDFEQNIWRPFHVLEKVNLERVSESLSYPT